MTVAFLQELDERQSRLGYVACLALVASRELDDRDTLRERFVSLAFERILPTDSRWITCIGLVDITDLYEITTFPTRKKSYHTPRGQMIPPFYYLSDLWLKQREMPSKTAPLDPERADVIIEHARHLGVLGLGYSLTETGSAMRATLPRSLIERAKPEASPNPMNVHADPALRAAMAYCYLGSDALLPYLLEQIAPRGGLSHHEGDVLLAAVDAMLETMRRIGGIAEAEITRDIAEYRARVNPAGPVREPTFGSRGRPALDAPAGGIERRKKALPEKKVHRHHLRPRLEHFVDIGLLARKQGAEDERPFQVTPVTVRAAQLLADLRDDPRRVHGFLSTKFFATWASIQGLDAAPADRDRTIRCFVEAYDLVKRSIGFTPGRTIALAASFLGLRSNLILEVDSTMEVVLEAARGPLNQYFQFSGGTRLDREYMIRVKPEIANVMG